MEPLEFDPDAAAKHGGIFGLPHSPEEAALVLIPVPWDVTTSYRSGAARGPAAIRAASRQVDLWDVELGHIWKPGIAMLEEDPELHGWHADAHEARSRGHTDRVNNRCSDMVRWVAQTTAQWRSQDKVVGIVGGDHSVPFGAIATIAQEEGSIGILHIDAHHDLRDAFQGHIWSHASIMRNVLDGVTQVQRLVQVGIRDAGGREAESAREDPRIRVFYDVYGYPAWDEVLATLPEIVWVSFDIDGLDPALCPNTGTPVPGGLNWRDAMALLRALGKSGRRIAGFDVNEVAPGPDAAENGDGWDSNVGARLVYKLAGWTLATQG